MTLVNSSLRTFFDFAALPSHTAESLRLSVTYLSELFGEAQPRRNSLNRC